jgi:hypothetical protein
MSDVSAIFGILLTLGISFPGMLTAWWLLFPSTIERAQKRLDETPWSCWWLGFALTFIAAVPTMILLSLPYGPAKFIGWTLVVLLLGLSCLGAAGLVAMMARQISRPSSNVITAGMFVRSAVTLELAAIFPVIGWFLVIPLATIISLGATAFALSRWMPREKKQLVVNAGFPSEA